MNENSNTTNLVSRIRRTVWVPALLVVALGARVRADSYNPASFGARYGISDATTAAANDAAIVKAIRRLTSQGGGELVITGSLALSKPIPWPTAAKAPHIPIHFAIRGTADAELYAINGGVLIDVPQPKFPPTLWGLDIRQRIENIGIRGGSVKITGGGKCISLRGVRIYGVEGGTALSVTNYDGGILEAYIHNNPDSLGFHLTSCHQVQVDLTSRENNMGGILDDCEAINGRLYCEANSDLGIVLNRLNRSNICLWLEANNKMHLQGKRRLCWGNVFTGTTQSYSNQGWDDDPLSRLGNQAPSSLAHLSGVGELVASAIPSRTIFPSGVELSGQNVTVRAGAFENSVAPNGQPNWIELRPPDRNDCGSSWQPGDVYIVTAKVVPDAAARAWYARNPDVQFRFGAGSYGGTCPELKQRWLPEGPESEMVMFGACTKTGSGLRLFLFPNLGAKSLGPDTDLSFTVEAVVRKLPR